MSDQSPSDLPPADQDTPAASGSGRGKRVAVGAGLATCAAIIGGGAVAYSQLSGGGAQPADVLPATADAAVRIDLNPSASQKIEVLRLLNRFPEARDALGLKNADKADLRESAVGLLADQCENVDYKKDVEPWVGDRFGASFEARDERVVFAIQVTDEKKAREGIDKLFTCGKEDYGVAFYEGYALVSQTQRGADDVLQSVKKKSLADNKAYTERYEQLGEPGVASVWANLESLAEYVPKMTDGGLTQDEADEIAAAESMAMAFRADGSALEIAWVGKESKQLEQGKNAPSIAALPSDSVFAATISGVSPKSFQQGWNQMLDSFARATSGQSSTAADDFIAQAEADTGLQLPEDLQTLMSEGLALSVGERNVDKAYSLSGPEALGEVDIALRAYGNGGGSVLTKISSWLGKYGAKLAVEEGNDSAAIGTNPKAAKSLVDGGKLGDSASLKGAIPDADTVSQALYLDVAKIVSSLKLTDSSTPFIEGLAFIESIGLSGGNSDGASRFNFRVVVRQ